LLLLVGRGQYRRAFFPASTTGEGHQSRFQTKKTFFTIVEAASMISDFHHDVFAEIGFFFFFFEKLSVTKFIRVKALCVHRVTK